MISSHLSISCVCLTQFLFLELKKGGLNEDIGEMEEIKQHNWHQYVFEWTSRKPPEALGVSRAPTIFYLIYFFLLLMEIVFSAILPKESPELPKVSPLKSTPLVISVLYVFMFQIIIKLYLTWLIVNRISMWILSVTVLYCVYYYTKLHADLMVVCTAFVFLLTYIKKAFHIQKDFHITTEMLIFDQWNSEKHIPTWVFALDVFFF